MKPFSIQPASGLRGEISLAGDKSIAHRCVILSAITRAKTVIDNFPANYDCLSTINALRILGVKIKYEELGQLPGSLRVTVIGRGLYGLREPKRAVFTGESGTTFRLLLGVLAGQPFTVRLTASRSLSQRPMRRVTEPLRMMGAKINAKRKTSLPAGRQENAKVEEYPPIKIRGAELIPIRYEMPISSAQVKSAILLAGLYAKGQTTVIEPVVSRDHTERLLKLFGAEAKVKENNIVIKGVKELTSPGVIYLPGDISSASFFIVMAVILPNSRIVIKDVSLNPTRIGVINVLERMGAKIKVSKCQSIKVSKCEPMGDIAAESSCLARVTVKKEEIPGLIDELPILMVAASVARGETIFEGIGELRFKETDRVNSMLWNLKKMGVKIKITQSRSGENIIINGVREFCGARVRSFGDHRTAMSMIAAGMRAKGRVSIDDVSCIRKSFPNFIASLKSLIV